MTVIEMRRQLIKHYGGSDFWTRKVAHMSDNQVLAFYSRLQRAGKL